MILSVICIDRQDGLDPAAARDPEHDLHRPPERPGRGGGGVPKPDLHHHRGGLDAAAAVIPSVIRASQPTDFLETYSPVFSLHITVVAKACCVSTLPCVRAFLDFSVPSV